MVGRAGGVQITPHKRRGPIAAEFSSPGPAAIALPGLFGSEYTVDPPFIFITNATTTPHTVSEQS